MVLREKTAKALEILPIFLSELKKRNLTKNTGSIYWWRIQHRIPTRLTAASGVRAPEVMSMGADPIAHNKEQEDLLQEQRYTVGKMTFIVEPRFQTAGNRTIASVLFQLMQCEIES